MDKAVSQIIKLYPNDLKITGVEKVDMEQAVHARNVVASVAALGVDNEFLGMRIPGHAEEHLIRGFADAVREASDIASYVNHLRVAQSLLHTGCEPQQHPPRLPHWLREQALPIGGGQRRLWLLRGLLEEVRSAGGDTGRRSGAECYCWKAKQPHIRGDAPLIV